MAAFGDELRLLRLADGLRQVDVCQRLGGGIARSTLANIEAGREPPSARVLLLLEEHLPDWFARLEGFSWQRDTGLAAVAEPPVADAVSRAPLDETSWRPGGSFDLESLSICYVFQHARSPSEIIEIRRVRARRNGASTYGLRLNKEGGEAFAVDSETLWGGEARVVEAVTTSGNTLLLHEVAFDRLLARGQRHEFATRTWIERDDEPGTAIHLDLTIPTREISIHLCFLGPERPTGYELFGPIADGVEAPQAPRPEAGRPIPESGRVAAYFSNPQIGPVYGIAWQW